MTEKNYKQTYDPKLYLFGVTLNSSGVDFKIECSFSKQFVDSLTITVIIKKDRSLFFKLIGLVWKDIYIIPLKYGRCISSYRKEGLHHFQIDYRIVSIAQAENKLKGFKTDFIS